MPKQDVDMDSWADYDQGTWMAIEEVCKSVESTPHHSPRKQAAMESYSTSSASRLQALEDVFANSLSTRKSRSHLPQTPTSRLERLSLSTPSSSRRDDSPTPSGRLPLIPSNHSQPQSHTTNYLQTPHADSASYISSDTEEEVEDMSTSSSSQSCSIFSNFSQPTPMSSISSLVSPQISRKSTLEYGDAPGHDSFSTPQKPSLRYGDTEVTDNPTVMPPSAKIRRTKPDTNPHQETLVIAQDNFNDALRPIAPSSRPQVAEDNLLTLGICVISHSRKAQTEMDRRQIAWGVQYEIARGITRDAWSWEDVTPSKLDELQGLNAIAAPKVTNVLLGSRYRLQKDLTIWNELDREQRAMVEDSICQRSLGVYGDWDEEPDWYGGRIIQVARLVKADRNAPFRIQLEPLEYQRATTRFARFLGSRRIIRLGIAPDLVYKGEEDVRKFLCQRFILCGRVFLPLRPKDGKVYLVEVSENFERIPLDFEGDNRRMSFRDIVDWHNPMESNLNQPTRKWVTRFDLGFSTSVPVLEFHLDDIEYIDDEYVPGYDRTQKALAEQIVTDGCGFMNRGALSAIAKHMGYEHIPTAVQGRIAGAKGLWVLHPDYQNDAIERPHIWIRDSQNKIKFKPSQLSRAHLIFDLVAPNRLTNPSRLSMQTIINLSHNGVLDSVFEKLMSDGIKDEFEKLTTWEGENAMKVMLHTVAKVGNVGGIRLQREAAGMGRAMGYGRDKNVDASIEALNPDVDDVPLGRAPFSFEPVAIGEKIFEMIAANFHPLQSRTLNSDLKQMVKNLVEGYVKSYHIPNPQSCEAFIVPDPYNILEENQIYFRSWQCIRDAQSECNPEIVTGPVLINRNPTRLPSDVQLVEAVNCYHSIYQNYRDVIICSTKGDRSLASKLAGGDYDGDTAMLTWMPEIVSAFKPPVFSEMPNRFIEDNFQKDVESVANFMQRLESLPEAVAECEFHRIFLLGLNDSKIGTYSRFHDNAIYKDGYDAPGTIRLAYMFSTVLDSSKTGLRVEPEVLKKDKLTYDRPSPACMPRSDVSVSSSNMLAPRRNPSLPPFILESLCEHGRRIYGACLRRYEQHCTIPGDSTDQDITSVFSDAQTRMRADPATAVVASELATIEKHVEQVFTSWSAIWRDNSPQTPMASASRIQIQNSRKDTAKALNAVRKQYAAHPEGVVVLQALGVVEKMKASCAYRKRERFAFAMAYRDICEIKASTKGNLTPMARSFADILGIPMSFARLYSRND